MWTTKGQGVNPAEIDAPASSVSLDGLTGNVFAAAMSEFSGNYNGIVGATVRYEASNPARLYVSRISAAISGCDSTAHLGSTNLGSVDATGNIVFRSDGFNASGSCTSLTPVTGDNIVRVSLADRNSGSLNVISGD